MVQSEKLQNTTDWCHDKTATAEWINIIDGICFTEQLPRKLPLFGKLTWNLFSKIIKESTSSQSTDIVFDRYRQVSIKRD